MNAASRTINAFTIDVEDYFHVAALSSAFTRDSWGRQELRVERSTDRLLALLADHAVYGTFFVLGWVAERYPEIVAAIKEFGHEIASHGYGHQIVYELSREDFFNDIEKSLKSLQDLTGDPVQAYRATRDMKYLDRAALTMTAYLDKLQQTNGLFFHAPDSQFYWGRGNGWVAAGIAELLRELPRNHPQRARIIEGNDKMMASLLKYQGDDGLWRQLLDVPESWPETSGTGMFTYAMVTGVKNGWLDAKTYGPAARKGWLGLVKYLDADGNVANVCIGTPKGFTVQYYLDRPRATGDLHGESPILWTASALMR